MLRKQATITMQQFESPPRTCTTQLQQTRYPYTGIKKLLKPLATHIPLTVQYTHLPLSQPAARSDPPTVASVVVVVVACFNARLLLVP